MKIYNLFVLMFLTSSSVFSFHIKTHEFITKFAISVMNNERVNSFASQIDKGVRDADLNLSYKWFYANHFYVPQKEYSNNVKGLIRGSADKYFTENNKFNPLNILQNYNSKNEAESWIKIGYVTHFVQDMASPPHSFGIMHGALDSFESYKYKKADFKTFFNAHKNLASKYLNSLEDDRAKPFETLNWLALMTQYNVQKSRFGNGLWQILKHGELGDRFGDLSIASKEEWNNFYFMQITLAVVATMRTLNYFQNVCSENVTDKFISK